VIDPAPVIVAEELRVAELFKVIVVKARFEPALAVSVAPVAAVAVNVKAAPLRLVFAPNVSDVEGTMVVVPVSVSKFDPVTPAAAAGPVFWVVIEANVFATSMFRVPPFWMTMALFAAIVLVLTVLPAVIVCPKEY